MLDPYGGPEVDEEQERSEAEFWRDYCDAIGVPNGGVNPDILVRLEADDAGGWVALCDECGEESGSLPRSEAEGWRSPHYDHHRRNDNRAGGYA